MNTKQIEARTKVAGRLHETLGEGDVLLTRGEVAVYLRVSVPTLERWEMHGTGPKSRLVGRRRVYRLADVRAFVERGAKAA